MVELFDLHTARGIALLVCYIVMAILSVRLIYELINLVIINRQIRKLKQAMQELGTMPHDEWESKWGSLCKKEYDKCDDPHRQEIEEDMEFFRKELEELKKDDNADV